MSDARLTLKVQPRSRDNSVVGFDEAGQLKVRVTAAPAEGQANRAVTDLLASALGVPKRAVTIERGQTGRTKLVRVEGLREEDIRRKLT